MSRKWVMQWDVKSWDFNKAKDKPYTVSLAIDGITWGCSCPHNKFRHIECKHIAEIKLKTNFGVNDPALTMKLTALRVEKLKAKGKTDKQIEKDLTEIFTPGELFQPNETERK